ncbi:MAG: amidohydrolase family protein, partial [Dehalococcoidia bacterium]|nr:amidohydrolase family protein [Dehalococcoidia bacterium]
MTQPSIKIEHALYALTMDADRRILGDASILIEGDTITRVGKSSDLSDVVADQTLNARDFVLTPGFVGGHMHISYAHATRGIFPDDLGPDYLPNVFKLQGIMSPEEERLTSLLAITELLKYGTTTFVDPGSTKHIAACVDAYRTAGCRIITGMQVTDRSNTLNVPTYETEEALEITERTIAEFDGELDGMMRAWAMPFSSEYASPELLSGIARIAKDWGT